MINYLRNTDEFNRWAKNRKRNDLLKGFNVSLENLINKRSFSSISTPVSISNYVPSLNNLRCLGVQVNDKKHIIYDLRCEIETKQEEYKGVKGAEATKMKVIIIAVVAIIIGCLFLFV